ncbi:universal stress protein [Fluviibacterium sp. S390]|uniref:universal stress protein n=1 Tax=Fluviibacterium sp. S390 TaxID=3415139 RepID=UPI003C7CD001
MKAMRILAAVGRFPDDDAVLQRGMEIAARHGVPLTIAHVLETPDDPAAPSSRNTAETVARDEIETALHRHGFDPADTEIWIETGSPPRVLVEICKGLKPALAVMRAHHKPWLVKKLIGSTTEKVIAADIVPVLLVRHPVEKPYGRVVLAIDGPDAAPAALSFVGALLPDAALHLVQAVEVAQQLEESMLRVGLPRSDLVAHHDVLAQAAESHLRALTGALETGVTWQVLRGEPSAELTRMTQDADVDLIALGPNRSGLVRRVFMGSVTQSLLRDAACDVLVGRRSMPVSGM